MGRHKKPTEIRKLESPPGASKPDNTLSPTGAPTPPKTLSKEALAAWKRIVPTMPPGLFKACDQSVLMVLCEAVARFEKATAEIGKSGEVSVGSTGQPVISPWMKVQDAAADKILKCSAKLGLDPVARTHLTMPEEEEDDGWIVN